MQTVFDYRINGHPGNYVRIAGWRLEEVRTISQRSAIPKEMSSERYTPGNVEVQEIFNVPEETVWVEQANIPKHTETAKQKHSIPTAQTTTENKNHKPPWSDVKSLLNPMAPGTNKFVCLCSVTPVVVWRTSSSKWLSSCFSSRRSTTSLSSQYRKYASFLSAICLKVLNLRSRLYKNNYTVYSASAYCV